MKKGVITDYSWRKKRIILYILIVLFVLSIPAWITMFYIFRHIKYMGVEDERYPYQDIYKADTFKISSIERTLTTSDGEKIWCAEVEADRPKGVIIYLSAMKEPSVTYFYGHAAMMKEKGYASFLLEVRAHGQSSGKKLGMGYLEVEDVRTMVEFIQSQEQYQKLPIILQGVSLGGSIAINATAQIPEVSGCIAMSPFASVDDQLDIILKKCHIPGFLRTAQRPFTHQALRLFYGKNNADNNTPMENIQHMNDKPVLVIATTGDESISVENAYRLQDVADNAEFWFRETSDHYVIADNNFKNVTQDKEYCNYIVGFINKIADTKK